MFYRHSGLFVSVGQEICLCHFRSGSAALAIALVSSGFGVLSGQWRKHIMLSMALRKLCANVI